MRVDLFDFELPNERIALRPARPRDAARLLFVPGGGDFADKGVLDLPDLLEPGDVLVFNDTRVIPAQLEGYRGEARIGATLHKRIDLRRWQAFVRNAKRLHPGDLIEFAAGVTATAEERHADGSWTLAFHGDEPVEVLLDRAGQMPLPPYIAGKRQTDEADRSDYQTMFAAKDGAVAAPTASLHFTPGLMASLAEAGIGHETLTLHVGAGTFKPVDVEDLADHPMHREGYAVSRETLATLRALEAPRRAGSARIVAVGTTTVRALESLPGDALGRDAAISASTNILISPGFQFRFTDALLTNFHLPKSTLLALVGGFMGMELMREAYATAVRERYRFYSYGDAMLIV